ncbi:hypothetical protein KDM41_17755, partial [bacterium]|nr:hypothetical protein [bacterium]
MITGAAFAASGLRATPLGRAHVATRLGALVLGLVTVMRLPAAGLVPAAGAVALGLTWTGMTFRHQAAALRPWAPVGVLMLLLHVFTTVAAAPLWHPSWAGLVAGILALVRVAASVGLLGLYLRVTSLDDLVAGAAWWLAPLRRLGVAVDDFGL